MRWRGNVSAHAGTGEWLWQRLSAIYIGLFALYILGRLAWSPMENYEAWRHWLSSGIVRVGFALFIASLLVHAWTGLRTIYIDYLHPLWLRFAVSFVSGLGLLALALWGAQILIRAGA